MYQNETFCDSVVTACIHGRLWYIITTLAAARLFCRVAVLVVDGNSISDNKNHIMETNL